MPLACILPWHPPLPLECTTCLLPAVALWAMPEMVLCHAVCLACPSWGCKHGHGEAESLQAAQPGCHPSGREAWTSLCPAWHQGNASPAAPGSFSMAFLLTFNENKRAGMGRHCGRIAWPCAGHRLRMAASVAEALQKAASSRDGAGSGAFPLGRSSKG